ncbi:hypothetical protein CN957_22840 [Bacillus cereus]|uniref:DUF3994 domain-containing protein n=1 Tax=Bacillus nitratireducens TaxID=2026193 RepID=A0ABU6PL62_9BACI|nr:DUF3994 domain-containing protein [Bacillus nitratireducens]OSX89246.1 hypothetical protein BTJ45_05260 [Bacillus mycoides]PEB78514.1 hypothetical protein COM95_26505 [Bacillus cereus]MDR4170767.1 DUF3994 domain-containing protein [Bacillus nitratireducens]MED4682038.1 DUF3994 domain-containing protein [Bacillus nitratireducens]PEQ33602.1 hypothetical protein CN467_21670 [Bacillus cereus]
MKAKRLVTLALPIMLLGGCATDKAETKAKDKVEVKAEEKDKLEGTDYLSRMFALDNTFETKVAELGELSAKTKDKSNDIKELNKEILKKADEINEALTDFDKVEPPKEFEEQHKTILKAVDCYKEAFETQIKLGKSNSVTKESTKKMKELMSKGNDYLKEGYTPLKEAYSEKMKSKVNDMQNKSVGISQDGKELLGEWGSSKDGKFTKGLDFKEDGTYIIYDDVNNTPYENTHMQGKWSYNVEKQQVNMTITEFVKDGKKVDPSQIKESVDYDVMYFKSDSLVMMDAEGNKIDVVKPK